MGAKYEFECQSCDYSTIISGGDDTGMQCLTTTIICLECQDLHDVLTSKYPWIGVEILENDLECPNGSKHGVNRWEHDGPCPKCGTILNRKDLVVLWD